MIVGLLLGLAMAQDPLVGAGLDPLVRQHFVAAHEAEAEGDWARAAARYQIVLAAEPAYAAATVGVARNRARMGQLKEAEALYRTLPAEPAAVEELAALVRVERPEEAMVLYQRLQDLRQGDAEPHRLEAEAALAAGLLDKSVEAFQLYLRLDGAEDEPEATGELMLALGAAMKEADRRDECREWLGAYLESWPEGELADETRARLERMDVEDAAEELAVGGAEALNPQQRENLEDIRMDVAAGRDVREALDALLLLAPRAPEVWAVEGDVRLAAGEVARAEQAWLTAVALEPDEATWRVALGSLLADRYGGRRHREAAEELGRALRLRPSWTELHILRAEVLQRSGRYEEALVEYRAYLASDPDGEHALLAAAAVGDLTRERPEPPPVGQLLSRPPEGVHEDAWHRFKLAKVYLESQDDDTRALEEVEGALDLQPDYVDALNLLAHLQLRAGDPIAALATYERSLQERPAQPLTVLAVGYLLQDAGRGAEARTRFEQAAELDAVDAWFALARLAVDEGDPAEGRRLLGEYFVRTTSGRKYTEALALRAALDRRRRLINGAIGGGVALGLGLPLVLLLRRRSGLTLEALLARHPECFHDVATVLSAMRHEVIKHNTTVLPTAADALERGDSGPAEAALERLNGGVLERWFTSMRELDAIGSRCGVRLNLRVKDPVFAPMNRAFEALSRLRPRDPARWRAISEAINHNGYTELGRLIREVCVLELDAAMLEGCWNRVTSEPGFAGQLLPELELQAEHNDPLPVRIFPHEMEDIVVNVLRNALQAVMDERGPSEARLALRLEEEVDFVTGLEWVLLRFEDNALSPLTDDMIRGRYIARGFGLVVDQVRRHQGSIRVVQAEAEGGSKAIVVRLPRAEVQ
mgnify:CR=1 FL=1